MSDQQADKYARARSDEEPGSHSGSESQPQERSIPGTASAREGYQPARGTTAGKPLEGVEAEGEEQPEAAERDTQRDATGGD
ncbi:hypothetical protein [Streptomyces sp. NPDC052701]|uniref:hypothetical protein n=1 Tax=Streptomyces sp. NPDC052701 TaxID=3155533 RepID=UPI0034300393